MPPASFVQSKSPNRYSSWTWPLGTAMVAGKMEDHVMELLSFGGGGGLFGDLLEIIEVLFVFAVAVWIFDFPEFS